MDIEHDHARIERRKAKFSDASRINILSDPLKDKALLSRSDAGAESISIANLKGSAEARKRLFKEIKERWNENNEDPLIAHGLRKLREIIISLYRSLKNDPSFISFAYEVNVTSINYSLVSEPRAWKDLINSLEFLSTQLSQKALCDEYVAGYVVYQAIESQSFSQGLHLLYTKMHLNNQKKVSKFYEPCKSILESCLKGVCDEWFAIISQLEKEGFLFKFLTALPLNEKLIDQAVETLSKAYKQAPKTFLQYSVFHSLQLDWKKVLDRHKKTVETASDGHIIRFKRG